MIILGLKNVILQKSENHLNRPLVAISVSRADLLLRLSAELVGAGHILVCVGGGGGGAACMKEPNQAKACKLKISLLRPHFVHVGEGRPFSRK